MVDGFNVEENLCDSYSGGFTQLKQPSLEFYMMFTLPLTCLNLPHLPVLMS